MKFDYDDMLTSEKQDSKGNVMGACPNCGGRTIMIYREYQYYHVLCEKCDETPPRFKEKSMDRAMKKWNSRYFLKQAESEE